MSIQIRGLDKLYRKLERAAATKTLEKPMQRAVLRLQRRMQEYPPALASIQGPSSMPVRFNTRSGRAVNFVARVPQDYKRTGTYGKRWTTRINKSGNGLVGKVGNNVRYAPFVGSEQFQARVHRGRWNTDARVVQQEAPGILADFQRTIDQALGE